MNACRRSRRTAGLTLIEVLMGTVIVSLVVISASWALSQVGTSKHLHEEDPIAAALLAREIHELAITLPTTASGKPAATQASEVAGLDTLDGASFSPPINSSLQVVPNSASWVQDVKLSVYDMSDLTTAVSPDFSSASKSSTSLYKLSVDITFRGTFMGTWWWWLNP